MALSCIMPMEIFGENDFGELCDNEVLKEQISKKVLLKYCKKAREFAIQSNNSDDVSWYNLITANFDKNINLFKEYQKSLIVYTNLGHSYILKNNIEKAKTAYENVLKWHTDIDEPIQSDYKLLFKLYPQKQEVLKQGLVLWNRLYKPFIPINKLYEEYEKAEENQQHQLATQKLLKVITMKNQTIVKDHLAMMMDYYNLAMLYESRQQYSKAITNYKKSLEIAQKSLDKNNIVIGNIYNSLGFVCTDSKYYTEAEAYYLQGLAIYRKFFNEDDIEIATFYNNIATLYKYTQQYKKSIDYYQKAITIEEKQNDESITATYDNIGLLYQAKKEYKTALKYYNKSLKLKENSKNRDPLDIATSYGILGAFYRERQEYSLALEYYNKALDIQKKELGEENSDTAESYHNLGTVYEELRDYQRALSNYKTALSIDEKVLDKNHMNIAITCNQIASIYNELENYKEAYKYILRALKIKKSLLKENDIDLAITYSNLGLILENMDRYQEALNAYDISTKIFIENFTENSRQVAINYNNFASIYYDKQEYKRSIKYLNKAKRIFLKQIKNPNHQLFSTIYNNLGVLYQYTKEYKQAYRYNSLSFDVFLNNRNKNFLILDSTQKSNYLKTFGNRIDNLLSSAKLYIDEIKKLKTIDSIQKNTLHNWLNYKGTLFEYQNILSMIKTNPKTSKETKKLIEELNQANIRLSKAEKKEEITNLEEQVHNIEVNLSKKNDTFKNMLQLNDINSSQIAKTLSPHQLYIDFARGNDNYYIFTINHQNHITFQEIDENQTKLIDQNIRAYRENCNYMSTNLKTITFNQEKKAIKEAQTILSKLYELIVKEYLTTQLKDVNQLIISSDGLLNLFPFEALYYKGHYLVENYTINYISSGKEFIRQTKLYKKHPKKSMTIFANANFDAIVKAPMLFGDPNKQKIEKNFSNLGRSEIDIVKKYYPKALVFEDTNATIANLVTAPSSKILHISTHGILLKDKNIKNPMLKSVLIFAGANQNQKNSTISALRLSALDLHNTELVVLSACQSGLGEIHQAEGVIGLPKALLQAGAKNVIMSLWTVSNVESAKLMEYFYANISKGLSYNEALKQAKLNMITMHPYFWSAFILSGL